MYTEHVCVYAAVHCVYIFTACMNDTYLLLLSVLKRCIAAVVCVYVCVYAAVHRIVLLYAVLRI